MGSKYKDKLKKKNSLHGGPHGGQPKASGPVHGSQSAQTAKANPGAPQGGTLLRRKDQERAIWAYDRANAAKGMIKEYEGAVQTFAAATLRSGLAVAVSVLERDAKRDGPKALLKDLAKQPVPGLPGGGDWAGWPGRVRAISSLDEYMLASRELLALATWLRRACRAVRALAEATKDDNPGQNAQGAPNAR